MRNVKRICIIFIFVIFLILLTNSVNAASDFNLKRMDFDITLNLNGTMDVIETWNIKVNGTTNTLFKTFILNKTKFSSFENVYVTEVKNGAEVAFTRINEEMYHVTKNCYYGLINSNGRYEIAWGINEDSGTKTYKVHYTVKDAVKTHNDCSELYWQFIGDEFEKNISNVQGTIKLPSSVSNIENLKVWAHGQLNGEIQKIDEQTVKFSVNSYKSGNLCEVRIVTTEDIFVNNLNRTYKNSLEGILQEEKEWAEEANRKREQERFINLTLAIIAIVVLVTEIVILIIRVVKNSKKLSNTPKIGPTQKLDYFRDFPNKTTSPAGAVFLKELTSISMYMPKVISATMLNLCLKKTLSFEVQQEKREKEKILVKMNKTANLEECRESEIEVYKFLCGVAKNEQDTFTMKELEKYASNHQTKFCTFINKIAELAEREQIAEQNYDKSIRKQHDSWMARMAILIVLGMFSAFGAFIGIGVAAEINTGLVFTVIVAMFASCGLFCADIVLCAKLGNRFLGLTQKGYDEKEQWKALQKYMEEFSLLNEKEVPDLVLWEKYLVFATAFGIADKVVKQLKVKYPEFANATYTGSYSYLYLMNNSSFSSGFISSLNASVSSAYSSGTYSSSSGGGGGFSGGGGGGGRWRWRRSVVSNYKFKLKKRKLFNIKKVYRLAKQA